MISLAHDIRVDSAIGTKKHAFHLRHAGSKCLRDGDRWKKMATRTTAGEYDRGGRGS